MAKPLKRWKNRARLLASKVLLHATTIPLSKYSGRRTKVRVGPGWVVNLHKKVAPDLPDYKEVNPGFGGISIRRTGEGKHARHEGIVTTKFPLIVKHDAGHVHQIALDRARGFKLKPRSALASFEDNVIRVIGFEVKGTKKEKWERTEVPLEQYMNGPHIGPHILARYFESPKAFLRAVLRMYRDPKVHVYLEQLNNRESVPNQNKDYQNPTVVFMLNYLKKHPQRSGGNETKVKSLLP